MESGTMVAPGDAAAAVWSGTGTPPPPIGSRVLITRHRMGAGEVVGYEIDGWRLLVRVKLDNPPRWLARQNFNDDPAGCDWRHALAFAAAVTVADVPAKPDDCEWYAGRVFFGEDEQGRRVLGEVLAQIKRRLLVEWEYADGSTTLLMADLSGRRLRGICYGYTPRAWVLEMKRGGVEWVGRPRGRPALSVEDLAKRLTIGGRL